MIDSLKTVPLIKTDIPGPKSKEALAKQKNIETRTVVYPLSFPIALKRGDGSAIEDLDGNLFIDWISGISVLNLGYSDLIRERVKGQMDEIWHALEMPTEARIEFMEALRESFPSTMRDYRVMFGISGADACETAINLSNAVHGGKGSTIAFEGAYHGVSGGIISATAGSKYKRTSYSSGFDVIRLPYPYKLWYEPDTNDIVSMMRKMLTDPEAGYPKPNSVIIEPILGEGGYIVPPPGFLKAVREFCDEFDLTMIVDEVQSGMGRTGKMWAFEWEGVTPDIVCISKSVGGGIPISVIYYRDDYDRKLPTPFHLGTFRANPLAMAAGSYILKEVPNHLEYVIDEGKRLLDRFGSIESSLIGQVRGRGFMVGVELVDEGKPLKPDDVMKIKHMLLENGLLMHTCGHYGNVFRYMGAINIPRELNNRGVEIFKSVITGFK